MRSGWRLLTVGVFIGGLFSILLLRMWFLQVTDIQESLDVAATQQLRVVTIEAPRGDVFDRDGKELMAGTVATMRVFVDRQLLSVDQEAGLIQNLSALLDLPATEIAQTFEDHGSGSRFPLGDPVTAATAAFVLEDIERFPGVSIEPVPVRVYPLDATAAHIVGYIGAPGEDDLTRTDIEVNDRVGKFGIERSYDWILRGTRGTITYQVNARGEILGVVDETAPQPGGSVVTTIDLDIQRFLEDDLTSAVKLARQEGEEVIRAAGVVLDPRDGSVIAMASMPSFNPSVFSDGTITTDEWAELSSQAVLNNFAIQGLYPAGSAFKPIVASLALEENISPTLEEPYLATVDQVADPTSFFCDGQLLFTNTPPLNDWKPEGHAAVNLDSAIAESCNLYFWSVALAIWQQRDVSWPEDLLQQWARKLGFGARTGVDLPFEQQGLVPDREWFQYNQQNDTGLVRDEGGWSGGDVMNIATGQGALTVTPLQMAVAYAAMVNGGTVWQPRVVATVRDSQNNVIFTNLPSAARKIDMKPSTTERIRRDLNLVVNSPSGTARRAFEGFCDVGVPDSECAALQEVGGKTGTAEIRQATETFGAIDTAWFVGAAPLSNPQYVVAIVVDQGGSGGKVAAPAARRLFQYLLGEHPDPLRAGADTER
ncbi:MAG: penicillin-binding protein 2 [Actinobacteria bacterium RBG_16_68_21]|nr:MAG: penicillin-binding protein 2 [Actinobacteria bacterium RBG_16_68_21]